MATANLAALSWQAYAGNTVDLIAPVLIDLVNYNLISINPTGSGIGATSNVLAAGVVIDNMNGNADLTVKLGFISTLVPRFQKATLPIPLTTSVLTFSGSGIQPVAYFYTGVFHGEGGSVNAFASQEAANVASITGGTTDAFLNTVTWNKNLILTNGYNLDNLTVAGFYDVLNPTNAGTVLQGGTWAIECQVYSSSNQYIYQLARNILSPTAQTYERRKLAGNGWTAWTMVGGASGNGQCILRTISTTQLALIPYNGNKLIVAGQAITLKSPTYFTNAGLANSTAYYLYIGLLADGVTPAPIFSTTGHVTGTDGTETMNGDSTKALVGWCMTDSTGKFVDTPSQRLVATWFNRWHRAGTNGGVSGTTGSNTPVELNTGFRVQFFSWGTDAVFATMSGTMSTQAYAAVQIGIGLDNGVTDGVNAVMAGATLTTNTSNIAPDGTCGAVFAPAEGVHYVTALGQGNGGGLTWGGRMQCLTMQ